MGRNEEEDHSCRNFGDHCFVNVRIDPWKRDKEDTRGISNGNPSFQTRNTMFLFASVVKPSENKRTKAYYEMWDIIYK